MLHSALLLLALAAKPQPAEAPRPYDVQHYRIDVTLAADGAFENEVAITLVPSKALTSVELDSFGLDVQGAKEKDSGQEIPFNLAENAEARTGVLTLRPKKAFAPKKPVTVVIQYKGKASATHEGLFSVRAEKGSDKPYFFTQFEPDYARRFFPSNDRPSDKATTEIFAVVDGHYTVLSNGKKEKDENFSEGGRNLRRVHWKQEQPHPTYAVALAVGEFEQVELSANVPSSLWIVPGSKDRAFTAVSATEHALSFQANFLGTKYPWPKHDQVAVPKFVWGGMENTSLVLMREEGLVLADKNFVHGRTRVTGLVAHELAHQWFGDLVTASNWSDIWLNEGFATYLTWKTEDAWYDNDMVEVGRARSTFVSYFRDEDGPRSHPLVVKSPAAKDTFDTTSYTKGAHVLRMLEHWVGEESFKKGLGAYLAKYAHGNASSEDFFTVFMKETKTEKELKPFKDAWLYRRGYQVITPEMSWDGTALNVTIRQRPNHADEKGPFVFKLPVVFHREGSPSFAKEEVILVDKPVVTARFELPAMPQWVNWNRDGIALAKIQSSAVSEQAWTAAVRNDPDPVWRTLAAFVLLGELVNPSATEMSTPTDAAMDALTHLLQNDASPYVREAVLQRLADAHWKRLPEAFAPVVLELAKKPKNLAEDALGLVRVRRSAMAALGKFEAKPGRDYLLELVMKPDLDLNYLSAAAEGAANLGDSVALASLRAAINQSKGRGYAYYRAAASALGAVTSPEVVPLLREFLEQNAGNNELAGDLTRQLAHNHVVVSSPQFASFVRGFVVENASFGDQTKGRVLRLLDEVKTKEAREALVAISEKAGSESFRDSAQRVLVKNFPGAASADVKPAKGSAPKKKK